MIMNIPLGKPSLSSRPSYHQVATYQNTLRAQEEAEKVIQDTRREIASFQSYDNGLWDLHPGSGDVVIDKAKLRTLPQGLLLCLKSAGGVAAGFVAASAIGALGWGALMSSLGRPALDASFGFLQGVGQAMTSPAFSLMMGGTAVLSGLRHTGLAEKGELEVRNGEVVRFEHGVGASTSTVFQAGPESKQYGSRLKVLKDHAELAFDSSVLSPTTLEIPRGGRTVTLPLEPAVESPWLKDRVGVESRQRTRRAAEKVIARAEKAAHRFARLDDDRRDFRPDEPGAVVVCDKKARGWLFQDASGRVVDYHQEAGGWGPLSARGKAVKIDGDQETYYDGSAVVTLDRGAGTLTYRELNGSSLLDPLNTV